MAIDQKATILSKDLISFFAKPEITIAQRAMVKREHDFLIWFGSRIKNLRSQKNISQEELAELADVDRSYVGGVERRQRNLSLLNIKKLADTLGIKPTHLFDDDFTF